MAETGAAVDAFAFPGEGPAAAVIDSAE